MRNSKFDKKGDTKWKHEQFQDQEKWQKMRKFMINKQCEMRRMDEKKKMGIHFLTHCKVEAIKSCSVMWADNNWVLSHSVTQLEQMMRDLIDEAERWTWNPNQASLWWPSTCAQQKRGHDDQDWKLRSNSHSKKIKFLGYIFNPAGKMQDSLDERMQSANKAWWRDVKIDRSKVVPWRIKNATERWIKSTAYSVFGSESWSWSRAILDRIKG